MGTEPSDPGRELRDQVKVWSQVGSGVDFEKGELKLMPTDSLRLEHRVIGRVMRGLDRRSAHIIGSGGPDLIFADRMVDFLSTYAHRVHHGKEEEILFRELDGRALSAEHRQMMEELVQEHVEMRQLTAEVRDALEAHAEGGEDPGARFAEAVASLTEMYPGHMKREEEQFFPAVSSYLDPEELQTVLEEMRGHDLAMIHEKYGNLADELEEELETWDLVE